MQTLTVDEESKTGLDFLADVWSGRVNNTLLSLYKHLLALRADIQTIRENIEMKTQAEQALIDAAQMLNQTEASFRAIIGGMQTKIDLLVTQAQSPTATPAPEDLTEEISVFSAQLDSMKSYAASLESSASVVAEQGGQAPVLPLSQDPASPVVGNPAAVDPETGFPVEVPVANTEIQSPASPTPLAGETGIGNTPTDGQGNVVEVGTGEVFAGQPQPGLDPATTQPVDSSTGIGIETPIDPAQTEAEQTEAAEVEQAETEPSGVMEGEWPVLEEKPIADPSDTTDQPISEEGKNWDENGVGVIDETIR